MNPNNTRRVIGSVSVLTGLIWLFPVVQPTVRRLGAGDFQVTDLLFIFAMLPLVLAPGIAAIVFGVRLYRRISLTSLKWVIGIFATFCALWITWPLSTLFPPVLPERIASSAYLMAGGLMAFPIYLGALWFLLPHFSLERPRLPSLISRAALGLTAFLLYSLLSSILEEYSPSKGGHEAAPEILWGLLRVIAPIVVAYYAYRWAAAKLPEKRKPKAAGDHHVPASQIS